jgi:glycosyltransferase involved in cell wall biosynthesis
VTYWHGLKGGMDLHGRHLLEGLAQRGHDVTVVSTKHPSSREYEEINGIRFHYLNDTTFGSSRKAWKKESLRAFKDIFRTRKVDLIVSQSRAGYGVVNFANREAIPFVTIIHGYETLILWSIMNQVANFKRGYLQLMKTVLLSTYYSLFQEFPILRHSSGIIAVSPKVAQVIGLRPFVNKNKIEIIYPGIDLRLFRPSKQQRIRKRLELKLVDTDRVILFLSLISKQKGADIAIKALRELCISDRNIKLILVGDGEYLEGAKRLAKELGILEKVIFAGFIPNEQTSLFYNAVDIFIFPTLRLETFGIVIAEAMACGKPVIASNIGSIPDVIDDGINGILFPPGDYQELASQIKRLLNDQNYSKMLSENAYRKAKAKFGMARMVEKSITVFESLVKNSPK